MGCDPVAFVGADLAFTGNRPYARGVTYEHNWRRVAQFGVPIERQWAEAVNLTAHAAVPDLNGHDVRTAPHLIAFRDWLVEQMRRERSRRFINATGAGILQGATLDVPPEELPAHIPASTIELRTLVRAQYRPFENEASVLDAARSLRRAAGDGRHPQELAEWEAFAPGLTRADIVDALGAALRGPERSPTRTTTASSAVEPSRGYVYADVEALTAIARSVVLVPMRIAPHRMERTETGARRYIFRTTAARIILCALRSPDGAVREDGRPLARALDFGHVEPGSYVMWRDEVQFRATDGTDPRLNGREYTVLVPACINCLEGLAAEEILRRDL
jgi:hypothetical protein